MGSALRERLASYSATAKGNILDEATKWPSGTISDAAIRVPIQIVALQYTENLCEKAADLRPRYDELSQQSTMFVDPDHPALRTAPLQQLWRQHLLSFSMIHNGLYNAGRFIVIAPTLNRSVQEAVAELVCPLRSGPP